MSYVRKITANGVQDSESNLADFLLVDNHATVFTAGDSKRLSTLGAPAPESTESLFLARVADLSIVAGPESFDPTPVPNGPQGTLLVFRTIANTSDRPITALRLRALSFPTLGSEASRRYSSRPDFRLASVSDGDGYFGTTLAAARLQPYGGGLNSTLSVDSVTAASPLLPGQSITVAIKFTVVRYGRHPLELAAETD